MSERGGPAVRIHVLGPMTVEADGSLTVVRAGLVATLLGLLVVHRPAFVSEEQLITELWADPPKAADSAFRTYLASVRRLVGRACVESSASSHRLHPELVSVDLEDALAAARTNGGDASSTADDLARLHERLVRPAFQGADHVLRLGIEIGNLAVLRNAVLDRWMRARLDAGEGPSLIPDLRRAVADQPEHEGRTALLMEALVRNGERRAALRAYRDIERVLTEVGLRPGEGLRALERSIIVGGEPVTAPLDLSLPSAVAATLSSFAGREALLDELSDRARPIMSVAGPPGSGRTAVAAQVAHRMAAAGVRVAFGTARDGKRPCAALIAALPWVADSVPSASDESLARRVAEWADSGPLACLILDDVDQADARTVRVIELIAKSPSSGLLVRLFGTSSAGFPSGLGTSLSLPPLSMEEIGAVLRQRLLARVDESTQLAVAQLSGGNALAVTSIADHLAAGGSIGGDRISDRLDDALGLTFRVFTERQREVLSAVAHIDHGSARDDQLAEWLERSVIEVRECLERAARLGLVERSHSGWRFRHPLLRDHAASRLDDRRRIALDRAIADDERADAVLRARHALRIATTATWPATLAQSIAASQSAIAAGQAADAAALAELVLSLDPVLGLDVSARIQALRCSQVAHELLGELETATQRRSEAFAEAERTGRVADAVAIATVGPSSGRSVVSDDGMDLLRRCIAMVEESGHPDLTTRVTAELVFATLFRLEGAGAQIRRLIDELVSVDDARHDRVTRCMVRRARYLAAIGGLDQSRPSDHARAMVELTEPGDDHDLRSLALVYGVRDAIANGSRDEIATAVAAHRALGDHSRRPADIWARQVIEASIAQLEGRREDARSIAGSAREYGMTHNCGDVELAWQAHLLTTVAQSGGVTSPGDEADVRSYALFGPMLLDLRGNRDDRSGGIALLDGMLDGVLARPRDMATVPTFALIAECFWNAQWRPHARRLLDAFEEACTEQFVVVGHLASGTLGPAVRIRALLLYLEQGREAATEALGLLDQSVEACDLIGAQGWASRTRSDQAVIHRSLGDHESARRCVSDAAARAALAELRRRPQRARR